MNKMKVKRWNLGIWAAMAVAVFLAGCTAKGNAETEFWVRANCEMCQETIEDALKTTQGVVKAEFDLAANTARVSYDSNLVNTMGLHQAVANAGYETKLVAASVSAYDALPKCCK